jgi:hypothetical protein
MNGEDFERIVGEKMNEKKTKVDVLRLHGVLQVIKRFRCGFEVEFRWFRHR